MPSLNDFYGIVDKIWTPDQIDKFERQIIEDWIDYEDALIIRDIQAIIGETN